MDKNNKMKDYAKKIRKIQNYDRIASIAAFSGSTCGGICQASLSHLRNALRQALGRPPIET